MPVIFNLQHLSKKDLHLAGELPANELDLDNADELIHLPHPLAYDLEIQKSQNGVLVQGSLRIILECECVRCLDPFDHAISLDPWSRLLPLVGEEQAIVSNDCVDLTPYLREDIVLAFPQHPLCKPECQGLAELRERLLDRKGSDRTFDATSSPWAQLDKLKLRD
jgi:DUF177 domain-containing protein